LTEDRAVFDREREEDDLDDARHRLEEAEVRGRDQSGSTSSRPTVAPFTNSSILGSGTTAVTR
jgi:hypothetical protein